MSPGAEEATYHVVEPQTPSTGDLTATSPESVVEQLERWHQFGAVWRVLAQTPDGVTISLCRCDGGEEVDRLTSSNPEVLEWLSRRTNSET